ncbi:MAG: carboxymuconolactone decarboxylase family protein [Solirubrobacteraceae bacterium]|jgi:alkylhydroperoxidase family enzyme
MPEQTARIAPLQAPYPPGVQEMLAKWMPPASEAEPLALFRTLAVHGELMSRMRPLGSGILGACATVPPLLREIVIHRTCALTGAQYEWGVHALAFGAPLGLSEAQLRSTVHGRWDDACWEPEQASVFRLADELHDTSTLSDELWRALAGRFQDAQILELIVTAGWYHVIGYLCNGVRVQDEEWAPGFPPADQGAGMLPATG